MSYASAVPERVCTWLAHATVVGNVLRPVALAAVVHRTIQFEADVPRVPRGAGRGETPVGRFRLDGRRLSRVLDVQPNDILLPLFVTAKVLACGANGTEMDAMRVVLSTTLYEDAVGEQPLPECRDCVRLEQEGGEQCLYHVIPVRATVPEARCVYIAGKKAGSTKYIQGIKSGECNEWWRDSLCNPFRAESGLAFDMNATPGATSEPIHALIEVDTWFVNVTTLPP